MQLAGFKLYNLTYYCFQILLPWDWLHCFSMKQYQRLTWCYLSINDLLTGA